MTATAAAMPLASGEPPINFAAHQIRAGNISGAREDFEQMLAMLVAAIYPGARLVAANPGDWGIDVLVGDLAGMVVIWQSKYFWPAVTKHRQNDIRSSFASAVAQAQANGYRIRRWVLCVPCSMDGPTSLWWDRWRARKHRETGIVIDLWHETALRKLLVSPDAEDVRRHYYDPYAPHAMAPERRAPVVALPDADAHRFDEALFVRQLREAGHVEFDAAKREFFNAELLARDIVDKGVAEELAALTEGDALAHSIWEAHFNQAQFDQARPGLHAAVMRELREADRAFPPALRAGPVHRCGLMHRIVDQARAGWVGHWREVAQHYEVGQRHTRAAARTAAGEECS
jgi:hypothetical protein